MPCSETLPPSERLSGSRPWSVQVVTAHGSLPLSGATAAIHGGEGTEPGTLVHPPASCDHPAPYQAARGHFLGPQLGLLLSLIFSVQESTHGQVAEPCAWPPSPPLLLALLMTTWASCLPCYSSRCTSLVTPTASRSISKLPFFLPIPGHLPAGCSPPPPPRLNTLPDPQGS